MKLVLLMGCVALSACAAPLPEKSPAPKGPLRTVVTEMDIGVVEFGLLDRRYAAVQSCR